MWILDMVSCPNSDMWKHLFVLQESECFLLYSVVYQCLYLLALCRAVLLYYMLISSSVISCSSYIFRHCVMLCCLYLQGYVFMLHGLLVHVMLCYCITCSYLPACCHAVHTSSGIVSCCATCISTHMSSCCMISRHCDMLCYRYLHALRHGVLHLPPDIASCCVSCIS